jgi:hypothetical protein
MKLLASPFIELCFGLITVQSMNIKYLPFHLKLLEILNGLSKKTRQCIPTAKYCIEMLGIPEFQKPAKSTEETLFEYELAIKTPKKQIKTIEAQQVIVMQTINTLINFCAIHARALYFPELAIPILHSLKKLKGMVYVSLIA